MRKCVFAPQQWPIWVETNQITNHNMCMFTLYYIMQYSSSIHIHTHTQGSIHIDISQTVRQHELEQVFSQFSHELHPRGMCNRTGADQWDQGFLQFSLLTRGVCVAQLVWTMDQWNYTGAPFWLVKIWSSSWYLLKLNFYQSNIAMSHTTSPHIIDINNRLDSIFEYMMCRLNYQGHG